MTSQQQSHKHRRRHLQQASSLQWERSQLLVDPEAFFSRMLSCIEAARHTIDFEYYIFENDSLGQRFVEALGEACRRGVRVRVMMDGVGSAASGAELSQLLFSYGVHVRIYNPLPWLGGAYRWSRRSGGWLYKFLMSVLNINRRDHRKLCVVDNDLAWVGSFNISATHLPVDVGGEDWRDYGVELAGPGVLQLVSTFDAVWNGHRPHLQRGFLANYLSNRSLRARRLKNRFVARQVAGATNRVWLVSAYFLPTAGMRRALLQACAAGTEVCLLLPEQSDVAVFPGLSALCYRELMQLGARVFLYQSGVMHAKALLVDDFAVIGSSNWNHRSTLHDLELDVVIRKPETLLQLEAVMRRDAEHSRELVLEEVPSPGVLSRLLYIVRYWM
ncbi:MAG: phosphatidylserine/phosphatidylglycerophosphate/cardiolipin synthase family protein [Halieaceae bacterium]